MPGTQLRSEPENLTGLLDHLNRKKISVQMLANTAKIDFSHAWRIIRGERMPSFEVARRVAQALKLPMDELYKIMYTNRQN